ncbi:MAG: hypothetical protein RLZZ244_683, partial [Verrucomicrobiota bacterium]
GTPQASDRVLVLGSNQLILGGGTLNVAVLGGGRAVAGTYTLIDYAGAALSGSQFSQISLASAVLGTNALSISLVNNTADTSIDLWVAAESRVWSGAGGNGGVWNLNSGSNWVGNTSFFNGDRVLFDDSATGSTTVLLNNADGALAPSEIVVNNTTRNYVFTGSGAIAGAGALTKQGAGDLTLATSNTFSGGVQLQAGRLILANAQALGTGLLTIAGGSLDSAVSDLNLTSNNAQVWTADFGFGGTQNLNLGTGGVLLSGGTRAVWVGGGVLTVGGAIGDGGAAFGLSKTGTGTLVLGGSSTFGGGLRIQAGAVRALHSNALGVPGAGVQVDAGASLELSGGIALNPGSLTVAGVGPGAGAGAIRSLSGLNTLGSPVRMAADTLVAVDAGVLNLTGALSGSAKLSKSGSGVLTLSGNHVAGYSGGTDVLQGVLALLRPEALPTTGVVNVSGSGATLSFGMGGTGGFSAEQISATLASPQVVLGTGAGVGIDTSLASAAVVYATELNLGSRAFSKSGAEMLTLSGNTVFGDLHILAGTLRFGTGGVGGAPGSGAIRVDSGAVMLVDRGVTTSLSQTVSGAGSLSLAGGLLELGNAANTLSGGIRLEGGTLSFVDGALGTAPVTVAGSAALRWNGGSADVSVLNGLRVADGQTLTLEVGSAAVTLSSPIVLGTERTAALHKTGNGTLTLSASNTFTGGVTLSAGTLVASHAGALGSGGALRFAGSATLRYGVGVNVDWSSRLGPLPSGVIAGIDTGGNAVGFAQSIAGLGGLLKSGSGILTLSGTNTFAGGVSLSGGTLRLSNAQALGQGALRVTGGVLDSGVASLALSQNNAMEWNGSFTFLGTQSLDLGAGAVSLTGAPTVNVAARTLTVGGIVGDAGNGLGFAKDGPGTLVLSGSNTFTGSFAVNGGNVLVTNGLGLGSSAAGTTVGNGASVEFQNLAGSLSESFVLNGGTLNVSAGSLSLGGSMQLGASGASLVVGGSQLVVRGAVSGSGGLVKRGAGALLLTGSNSFTGAKLINAGSVVVTSDGALGSGAGGTTVGATTTLDFAGVEYRTPESVQVNSGIVAASSGSSVFAGSLGVGTGGATFQVTGSSLELAGTVFGTTPMTKLGAGRLILSGNNTFSGTLTVSAGTLNARSASALGGTGSLVQVTSGAALELQDGVVFAPKFLSLAGSGVLGNGALRNVSGANVFSGSITLSAASRVQSDSGSLLLDVASGHALTASNANLTVGGAGDVVFADALSLGTGALFKEGTGRLVLSAANSFSGGLSLSGGVLELGNASGLGAGSLTFAGGTLRFATGFGGDVSGRFAALSSGVNAVVDTAGNDVVFGTALSGAGTVTKRGAGALTLSGSSEFGGVYRVEGGSLVGVNRHAWGAGSSLQLADGVLDLTADGGNFSALSVGAGTLRLGVGTSAVQVGGSVSFVGGVLDVQGTVDASAIGRYTLLQAGGGLTGTLASGSIPDSSAYYLRFSGAGVDLQRRSTLSVVSLTSGSSAMIVGGTIPLSMVVRNDAPSLSDDLSVLVSVPSAFGGGTMAYSGIVAGSLTGSLSLPSLTAGSVGASQSASVRVAAPGSSNGFVDRVLSIDVYDHASPTASGTLISLGEAFADYSAPRIGLQSGTVANAAGYRVPLRLVGSNTVGNLSLSAVSGLAAGGTASVAATLGVGQGAGVIDQIFSYTYADDSTLAGSASSLGSVSFRVTGSLWDHASPTVSGGSLDLGNIRLGATAPVVSSNTLSVSNASGFRVALSGSSAAVDGISISSISALAAGQSTALGAVFTPGANAGSLARSFVYTFADDSSLAGALGNVGTALIQVTGTVWRAGSGVLGTTSVNLGAVREGEAFGSTAIGVSNGAAVDGFSEKLNATIGAQSGNAVGGGSVSLLVAGQSDTSTLQVGLSGTATAGAKSGSVVVNFVTDGTGTSGLALESVGSGTVSVVGSVYRKAAGSLEGGSVDFGAIREGGVFGVRNVSVRNGAMADGYSDDLATAVSTVSAGFSGSGSVVVGAGSVNTTGLSVGYAGSTASAGAVSGSAVVTYTSRGQAGTGLG